MGIYLNPDNVSFQEALNSEIYIDKSRLIQYTNKVLKTKQKYISVSRPRRFGKSMAADMLTAYY
ncbi:MAG: AAA family ATPase, partial [Ruminococcus sp.]|nr:AAA family ATPase [Ruminococcus sp.]